MCQSVHIFRFSYSSRATRRLRVDSGYSSSELCKPVQFRLVCRNLSIPPDVKISSKNTHSTAQHSTVQYSTAQHNTTEHSIVQQSTAQYYNTAQHRRVQYSIAQHSTAQHSTAQYSTVQYSTVPLLLSDFNETWIFSTEFRKYSNVKFNENPSIVGAELFRADRQTAGRTETDMTKIRVPFAILRTRLKWPSY